MGSVMTQIAASIEYEIIPRPAGLPDEQVGRRLETHFCQKPRMSEETEHRLAQRQAAQIRTDIANIDSSLEMIMAQLVRLGIANQVGQFAEKIGHGRTRQRKISTNR
jgi:hypothetical protein